MKNIAVFTSGGDAPGMNAAIRAVVRTGIRRELNVFGIERGLNGLIKGSFKKLKWTDVSQIISRGGTILHSARSPEFKTKEGRKKAYDQLKKNDINGIVAIGGNGTFTGAEIFTSEYPDIAIVGLPGTIDNDLYGTDFTIGYDTAINTAMQAIDKIKDTAIAHDRVFFIEVMGRDAGFIALRSGIATGAEAVLIPEKTTSLEKLAEMLKGKQAYKRSSSIVVVAEGDDQGGAFEIARKLKLRMPNLESRVTILGHLQRGGSPTCMDRVLASRLGMQSVDALLSGETNVMLGQLHRDIVSIPFSKAIKHHQDMDKNLLHIVELLN